MTTVRDDHWLSEAVALATANVAEGGGPFGALVVCGDEVVASGVNRVTRDNDPTAHAEVVAIRGACARRDDFALTGCVLYTSCEPCPLCLASALWSRLDRVVYAADRDDAARGGFDDRAFYDLFGQPRTQWPLPVQELRLPGAAGPFDAWLADTARTHY